MKRLRFKKEFKNADHAIELIPEIYKLNDLEFELTDGKNIFKVKWIGNNIDGKGVLISSNNYQKSESQNPDESHNPEPIAGGLNLKDALATKNNSEKINSEASNKKKYKISLSLLTVIIVVLIVCIFFYQRKLNAYSDNVSNSSESIPVNNNNYTNSNSTNNSTSTGSVDSLKNKSINSDQVTKSENLGSLNSNTQDNNEKQVENLSAIKDILNNYYYDLTNDNYEQLLNYYDETVDRFLNQTTPITKYEIVRGHKSYHGKYPFHIYKLVSIEPYPNTQNENNYLIHLTISIKKFDYEEYKTYQITDIFTFDDNNKIKKVVIIK